MPKHIYEKAGKYTVGLRSHCPPETGVDSTVAELIKTEYITVSDTVTSVEGSERVLEAQVVIFPNPMADQGIISVSFPHNEVFDVKITTLLGREITIAERVRSKHEEYQIPSLPSGIYNCQVRFGNGRIISKPFIIIE
ncbi:MAG: T9SS type A sorting domain-containing protein [Ignavibacteria bacterium]|nr:T9SS type A sorting domain-containing protein [Ignavibacteria bacterium]